MNRLLRRPLARFATLFAVVAFIGGLMAQHVHVLRVAHVTCVEHGDLLELSMGAATGDTAADDPALSGQDVASSPAPGGHDHDCPLTSTLSHPGALGSTTLATLGIALLTSPAALPSAPRAPPLRWAPKTSPPTIG